jgi:hypothetical protein
MTLLFPVEKGRPGSVRVEYRACKEDVEALLAKGYSFRMAWEEMQKQGRVQSSYSAFCDYVRGQGKRLHSRKKPKHNAVRPRIITSNGL